MPVTAGESLELDINGIIRLAQPRMPIVSDCEIQIDFFHVPYRHVYGDPWTKFIKTGVNESTTFTGVAIAAPYRNADYLCLPVTGANINRALLEGYNRILFNYYHVKSLSLNPDDPSGSTLTNDFDWFPTTETGAANCRKFGRLSARLPHILNGGTILDNTGIPGYEAQSLESTDWTVNSVSSFDIRDLAYIQGVYRSEAEKSWLDFTYQDVMQTKWGASINKDADPNNYIPEHLYSFSKMISGQDINGTDDATLGTAQGKTLDYISCQMPRRMFDEHGLVFVLMVLRYPLVHTDEVHPLLTTINPSYTDISGDDAIINQMEPVLWDPSRWVYSNTGYTPFEIYEPAGQHYRFQNNRIHSQYKTIPGFPFLQFSGTDYTSWYYYRDEDYSDAFQVSQLEHWQAQLAINCTSFHPVSGPMSSIFAGT